MAGVIALGSGCPLGAEGPAVQTGSLLGMLFGRGLHLGGGERKTLLVAGAAAGLTATFGAPVAAVFLAVELWLLDFRARALVPVALAGAVAAAMRWAFWGAAPLLPGGTVAELTVLDLPLFALLGLAAGLLAVLLTRAVDFVAERFDCLSLHWMWWPALAGGVVGVIGWVFPEALGAGTEHLKTMAAGQAALGWLLAMLLCKSLAWAVVLGSGSPGSVVGPLLLVGGALGGTLAGLAGSILPHSPQACLWVGVGMAAVLAGGARVPLTAVVLALELTHEPAALLPLLVACTLSDLVSRCLVTHTLLARKHDGQMVPDEAGAGWDVGAARTVGQVMTTAVVTVPQSLPLARLWDCFQGTAAKPRHQGYPVVDERGRLAGMVHRSDLRDGEPGELLGWLIAADLGGARSPLVTWPGEPLRDAAERMLRADVDRLPVVAPEAPDRLVGVVSRSDILKALVCREAGGGRGPAEDWTKAA